MCILLLLLFDVNDPIEDVLVQLENNALPLARGLVLAETRARGLSGFGR